MALKDYSRTWWSIGILVVLTIISFLLSMATDNLYLIITYFIVFSLLILSIIFGIIFYIVDKVVKEPTEKLKFKRGTYTAFFIIACIGFLIFYYYYALQLPDSIGFVREGVTAGVSAIIGGLAVESILRLEK